MSPDRLAERFGPHVLREYALLADGERGALIGPLGDVAWLCFPSWGDDALLSSLIGGGGAYAVTPSARCVWGGYYERGSLIWRSRWITDEGIVECREALAMPGRRGRAVLLRRVIAVSGDARVRVLLELRGAFGRRPAWDLARDDEGAWRGRTGDHHFCWAGAAGASVGGAGDGQALSLDLEVEAGSHHDLVLALDARREPQAPEPQGAWTGTEAAWAERVPRFEQTMAPRDARHAYAVLAGLTSSGGGMVAAATTSLPERAREGTSYDYRYVWIRDQAYAGQAAARAGGQPLMDDAVGFLRDRLLEDGPQLSPAYTVDGDRVPEQRSIGLPGYPGGADIVGNQVRDQFQLDGFGEALLLFAAAARHDHLDADGWRAAKVAADAIAQRWQERGAGVWEVAPAEWTHSRLICAAGLRAMAGHGSTRRQTARWLALAERIVADAASRCVHPSGRWQRAVDDERPDAALLLAAIRGAIPADDPRTLATLRATEEQLVQDGYAYRFRPDERPLGEAEGAFLLCGFFMSLAYAQQGDPVTAARWFERNRAACGPPGLLSEEYDVEQRQLRGNLPQAFVHALLLECSATLG